MALAGREWIMLDYGDKLALDDETVAALDGLPHSTQQEPPEVELRECAILNVVAAHMVVFKLRKPSDKTLSGYIAFLIGTQPALGVNAFEAAKSPQAHDLLNKLKVKLFL